jgi:integrase
LEPKRISKKSVDALQCPEGSDRVFLWDKDLKGFGITALPSGKKVYVVQYRQDGRSRRMKIGDHGRLTPDEARDRAKELLGDVAKDRDPIAERKARRSEQPFRKLAEGYMREHAAVKCKHRTQEEYNRLLRLHILPALGSKSASQVTKAETSRLHTGMAAKPSAANRCLSLIDAIWNRAVNTGEIVSLPNPTKGIEPYPEQNRDRYLTLEEMKRLGQAMHLAETTGLPWVVDETGPKAKHLAKPENRKRLVDVHAVAAIRMLILTGARLREILYARWDWVDWDRGILFLPNSKTDKKPIYLSQVALEILAEIPRHEGNPHIFPGEAKGTHRHDLKRPWNVIRRYAGLLGDDADLGGKIKVQRRKQKGVSKANPSVRIHDLRHSFASVGVGGSLGLPLVGKLLGHSQASTTQRYAHLDADPLHKAANLIGSQIAAALAPVQA